MAGTEARLWWMVMTGSLASSGSKLAGALSTTISCWSLRLSFSNTVAMDSDDSRTREIICKKILRSIPAIVFSEMSEKQPQVLRFAQDDSQFELEMEAVTELGGKHAGIVEVETAD